MAKQSFDENGLRTALRDLMKADQLPATQKDIRDALFERLDTDRAKLDKASFTFQDFGNNKKLAIVQLGDQEPYLVANSWRWC